MELDILAYHPHSQDLVHLEPSIDAHSWAMREKRFAKKFAAAKKYVFTDIFTWLPDSTPLRQVAVLISHPRDRNHVAGGLLMSIDEFFAEIRRRIASQGIKAKNAIPEQYPRLRTVQLALNGYYRVLGKEP